MSGCYTDNLDPSHSDECRAYAAWLDEEDRSAAERFDYFLDRACRLGRNYAPDLAHQFYWADLLDTPEVCALVADHAWSAPDFPENHDTPWCELFSSAGFARDGVITDPPAEPMTLFRGCTSEGRFGMAWTGTRSVAEKFASGELLGRPDKGLVYTAVVEPWRILAHLNGRNEDEFVIDTDGLEPTAVAPLATSDAA
ncbi:hypothetical protein [Amycolatopsis sp. NBC_01480]|uniref:hypothetical protein n=1 Tax=Amycolatopsis sp. NBC_01480 TaxID=2903562 RepID=UPI002E29A750|nr:hypothetical protein [Amycolatopsis sp. NBC_01480]